jgi:nucleoside-triphosphatase THEP1
MRAGKVMKEKKCSLVLLTGAKNSGKTTFVQQLVEKLKKENYQISGFTAPSIYEGAFLLGFDILCIRSGRKVKLAKRKSAAETFTFSKKALALGNSILNSNETKSSDLVIIDEFGPLELAGKGWRKGTDELIQSAGPLILLVVRKESAEKVRRLYNNIKVKLLQASNRKSADIITNIVRRQKMDNEKICDEVRKTTKDGQITCGQCFEIADRLKVSLKSVGSACNKKKIKIRSCQLACFK